MITLKSELNNHEQFEY